MSGEPDLMVKAALVQAEANILSAGQFFSISFFLFLRP
jgi:hypothetical protein